MTRHGSLARLLIRIGILGDDETSRRLELVDQDIDDRTEARRTPRTGSPVKRVAEAIVLAVLSRRIGRP